MILIFSAKMAWLRLSKLPRVSLLSSFVDFVVKDGFLASLMMSDEAGQLVILLSSTARTWIGVLTEGHESFKRLMMTLASRCVWMHANSLRGESGCVSCMPLCGYVLFFKNFVITTVTGPTGIVINQHASSITPKVWLSSSCIR